MKPSTISPAEPILGSQSIDAVYSGEDADWETSGESGGILVEDGDYVSVPGVDRLIFDGGELTDNGDGSVTIDLLTEQDVIALITPDTTTCDSISIISSKGSIGQGTHADLHAVGGTLVRIDETATTPGINLEIAFSGLDGITDVYVHGYYTANHTVTVDIYNYDTTTWTTILTFSTSGSATELLHAQLADGDPYVDGSGNAKLRAYHAAAGNPTHDLFLDFVSLAHVAGGGGGLALDGLSDVDAPTPDDGDVLTWDDYAGAWVNAGPPSGTVPDGTDPGDLLVWDGASWDVLPIGADTDVLTADSGETLGVKWASGGGGPGGDYVSGASGSGQIIVPGIAGWADVEPASPSAYDDEFTALSGWTTLGTLDTSNVTDVPSHWHVKRVNGAVALDGIYKAAPVSFPFTITCKLAASNISNGTDYNSVGILLTETSPGKCATYGLTTNGNPYYATAYRWTNRTTLGTYSDVSLARLKDYIAPLYMRLECASSSSVTLAFSDNGLRWYTTHTAETTNLTIANIGLYIGDAAAAGTVEAWFDWFRVT